ncbi:MAG: hypothetical protein M0Z66_08945 [Thermaerobacter sp.]|nr:hypothetical protein [Thermaerobacter sp.]
MSSPTVRAANTPARAALWMEALLGSAGLAFVLVGMVKGLSSPAQALPHGAGALALAALHGSSVGLMGVGLWLLALGPVAAIAAGALWAIRARHLRTALLALVTLAAIALAAFVLSAG